LNELEKIKYILVFNKSSLVKNVVENIFTLVGLQFEFISNISVETLLLVLFIFLVGIALAIILDRGILIILRRLVKYLDQRSEQKTSKQTEVRQTRELSLQLRSMEKNISNFIWPVVLIITGLVAFYSVGYDIYTEFTIRNFTFSIYMFIMFFVVILIFILFIKTVLSPITKLILQAIFGRSVSKWTITREHGKLVNSLNLLVLLIGIYIAFDIALPNYRDLPFYWIIRIIFGLAWILIGMAVLTGFVLFIFRVKYMIPQRVDIHAASAIDNIIIILSILITLGLVMNFFNIDITVVLGSLAFIGFALAFGMQDSVANIMAGFMLAADKPFIIGDRVRVGEVGRETWGDVTKIGLNTTHIRTVEDELVVLPNSFIARNEIFNYTRESPVIVHKINIGISYGSDWRLAKKIMLEETRMHPRVKKNPQPFVQMDDFSEFSIELKLWVWLKHALDRDQVRSDLLEAIKDRFDTEGIEIPFPYRTIVYKKDIQPEKRLMDPESFTNVRRYASRGRDYFEFGDWHPKGAEPKGPVAEEGVRILVTAASLRTANKIAQYSFDFAKKANGKLVVLYIMAEYSRPREEEGLKILGLFEKMGTEENVLVGTIIDIGDIVDKIIEYAENNQIDFIIIGESPRGGAFSWARENIEEEIKDRSDIPVMTVTD
jgi:small-conductance mechanosensitive channel